MHHLQFWCLVFTGFFPLIANALNLVTPTTVNSPTDLGHHLPEPSIIKNATNALNDLVGCFMQEPIHQPQLSRTNFIDCYNAEEKIAALQLHGPIHFIRNNDSEFVLPNAFTYRTCVILLDMVSATAEDVFYVAQIRAVVIDTARRCTSLRRSLGGKSLAGPKQLLEVCIYGRA